MTKPENIVSKELMLRLEHRELFAELCAQLKKDLRLAGMDDQSIAESTPSDLVGSLVQLLNNYLRSDPETLRHLFYRIDLSEDNLVEALGGNFSEDLSSDLTVSILLRELKKISDRKKYSLRD